PSRPLAVLIGPPGSGKTTVGGHLAALTGTDLRDTDADIVTLAGKTIPAIFAEDGEPAFRALEAAAVAAALREHIGVLSLGGGAVLAPSTQAALADYAQAGGVIVFLDVSLACAIPRVGLDASRPLLSGDPRARWTELMTARRPIYERLATMTVLTNDRCPQSITGEIATVGGFETTGQKRR
ncbi:MAG: shikimate kinase, partial [Promicromonosporaceae bacterium]|nr:shikimate kinase [Promicromonosporaceae bacterium]